MLGFQEQTPSSRARHDASCSWDLSWVQHIAPRVLTSRESPARSAWPLPRRIPKPCLDMGRHENVTPGPSWTVVTVAQHSPLLHTAIASGFCTAPGLVIGRISPSPHNGRFLRL